MDDQIKIVSENLVKKANRLRRNQLKNSGVQIPRGKLRKSLQPLKINSDISASEMIISDRK
jgi:hypothetical protein